ncbi:MAG: Flp family type IVb pilin [Candidatus Brocadiales bacterium]
MVTRMYVNLVALREGVRERIEETLRRLHEEKDGAAMVEYALLIAGISVALIAAVAALYGAISGSFGAATTAITPAP